MAPRATPVLASQDGRREAVHQQGRGLTIYQFDPPRRSVYYYAHLDGYAEGLREGQTVQRGQVIGYVGSTGNASADAPHLHFAIFRLTPNDQWWKGEPINPYPDSSVTPRLQKYYSRDRPDCYLLCDVWTPQCALPVPHFTFHFTVRLSSGAPRWRSPLSCTAGSIRRLEPVSRRLRWLRSTVLAVAALFRINTGRDAHRAGALLSSAVHSASAWGITGC
jgi:hypothetical protein